MPPVSLPCPPLPQAVGQAERALSTRALRRAALQLLADWPAGLPRTLGPLGGPKALLAALKLAGQRARSSVLQLLSLSLHMHVHLNQHPFSVENAA